MDKFSVMDKLLEQDLFDDTIILILSLEDGALEVTPMGGTFKDHDELIGQEAYTLSRVLLDAAEKYGGVQSKPTGGITFINPKEKH